MPPPGTVSVVESAIPVRLIAARVLPAVNVLSGSENVAVALRASDIANVQVGAVPVHAPLQPVNVERVPAVAVRVTDW